MSIEFEPRQCSVDEAVEAVTAAAWTESPRADADEAAFKAIEMLEAHDAMGALNVLIEWRGPQRKMIHTMAGFGCDLPLESAIERIRDADEVGWSLSIFAHDLIAVGPGDKAMRFDVRCPDRDRPTLAPPVDKHENAK